VEQPARSPVYVDGPLDVLEEMPMQETSLIGYPYSFDQIYETYRTPICLYLYRLVGDRAQAEDLTQDTFLKVFRALPSQGEELKVGPWLYRIATNTAYDAFRRGKPFSWLSLQTIEGCSVDIEATDPQQDFVTREVVHHTLSRMPKHYRKALVLWLYEGYSASETAALMHTKESGIKMFLFRARRSFREQYEALQYQDRHPRKAETSRQVPS
jgi:RNA polymerase sigma-70 factor, ECF subfamily